MHIVIAGGHGQVALALTEELGPDHHVVNLIRDPDQAGDVTAVGGTPAVIDLETAEVDELAGHLDGADAVVFAAGAGPGSGAARKEAVDHGAAVLLRDAAMQAGVTTYVMLSSMGTDDPPDDDDAFSVYLQAKARADRDVMDSDLAWTIVRPGRLTNDERTGTVTVARHVDRGEVARADVAAVLAAVLRRDDLAGVVFEVVGGDVAVETALDAIAQSD